MTTTPSLGVVTIIDYDAGNILNAVRAIKHIGYDTVLATKPSEVPVDTKVLVIPGVGAFGQGMAGLREREFERFLQAWVGQNKPLMGICLGMQLLFQNSIEMGNHKGLGFIEGHMDKIPFQNRDGKKLPVPHIGWCKIEESSQKMIGLCYFVHSYFATDVKPEHVLAWAQYGDIKIPAVVRKNNVIGFQFHPEKSSEFGLQVLRKFMQAF